MRALLFTLAVYFVFLFGLEAQTIFTVTNNSDSGAGSLRQAISDANGTSGIDTIKFNIPSGIVANRTITLSIDLPSITEGVVIDGTTQPIGNAFGNSDAKIIIDGNFTVAAGLIINASNCDVYGLAIINCIYNGISIGNSTSIYIGQPTKGNVILGNCPYPVNETDAGILLINVSNVNIAGNFIGTDTTGLTTPASQSTGIAIIGTNDNIFIGGSNSAEKNIISGNATGMYVAGAFSGTGLQIKGNYIGLDKNGGGNLGNFLTGILMVGSSNVIIGGYLQGEGNFICNTYGDGLRITSNNIDIVNNVISGNSMGGFSAGINLINASDINIKGNYIGTDSTGLGYGGTQDNGIIISDVCNNVTIGGASSIERNIISGNQTGISITSFSGTGLQIKGNYVGLDKNGGGYVGNNDGISITSNTNLITIGGYAQGERNLICNNGLSGIRISPYTNDTINNVDIVNNLLSGNSYAGISFNNAFNIKVLGNLIGTDTTGTMAYSSSHFSPDNGISITGISKNNIIGGLQSYQSNIIAFNGVEGIKIDGINCTGNQIRGNHFIGNSQSSGNGGILLANSANNSKPTPRIIISKSDTIWGLSQPYDTIELFTDTTFYNEGCDYVATTIADVAGKWVFTGSFSGEYTVTSTDSLGNTSQFGIKSFITDAVVVSNVTCNGADDGVAIVNVTGSTAPYTYNWTNGATDSIATGLSAGTNYVTVTDVDLNTVIDSVVIVEPAKISTSILSSNPPCYGMLTGTADVSVSSGTTPYSYNWSTTQTSSYIENLGGGTYYVTVTDANGCYAVDSAVITVPDKLTVSAIITNPSTIGGSDGAIDITISGGTLPMNTIDWFGYGTNEDIFNLYAGLYQLSLRDAHSCGIDTSFTLSDPPCNLQVNFDITNVSCHGLSDGAVVMHISNGFEPYSYTWADAFTDTTVTNLSTNVYNVTAVDAVGCELQTMAWVQEPDTISTSIWGSELLCHGDSNGTASVTALGGTSPYTYLWSTGDTTSDIELQTSNYYYVTITDSHNCQFVDSAEVTEPSAISVSSIITNTSTVGGSDGFIDITAMGGTTPYGYDWSTGFAYEDAYGLPEGTFYVTITDNNSCVHIDSFIVSGPACNITTTIAVLSNASCWQYNNGTAEVSASNGTSPYNFEWSDGELDAIASYLSAGVHYVTVTDNIGCSTMDSVEIIEPDELISNVTITDVTCFGGSDGIATASGAGGTPPYSYYWYINSYDSTVTGLSADYYMGDIYDANNCWTSIDAVVGQPAQIIVSGTTVSSSGSDGQVDISILNGVSPFTYLWSNNSTIEDISGIAPGTYSVTVTDVNGCANSASFIVNDAIVCNGYDVAFSVTNVTCYGNANGEILTMVIGGTSPFSYTWSTGDFASSLSNLSGGLYSVTVTDINNCYYSGEVNVLEPESLQTSLSASHPKCHGGSDGYIDMTVTGGTTPYSIVWYKGGFGPSYIYSYSEDIYGLVPDYYGVIVTDANGCSTPMYPINDVNFMQIDDPSSISIYANVTPESTGNDASIDITINYGTSPYSYLWSNGATTEDLINITNGAYSVTVTDINSCTAQNSFILNDPACVMYSDISSITYISCYGGSDGEVTMQSFDGTSPYSYNWSNGQSSETITSLQAGNYSLTVTDANSCIFVTDIYIQQPDSMTFQFDISNVTCNGGNNGSIITNFFGGTSPYNFLWSNSETTIDISGLSAGQYSVTVIDYFGCTQLDSVNITEPSIIVNNINESICSNDSIFVGGSWQTTAGTYYDTFQTALGCDSLVETTLIVDSIPYVSLSEPFGSDTIISYPTIILDAGLHDEYLWSDGSTGQFYNVTGFGWIYVTVTDYNNVCGSNTDSIFVDICICGIAENNLNKLFNIFPNPATDEFFIETPNFKLQTLALSRVEVSNFKLYSIEGKLFKEGKLEGSKTHISTKDLESGVYFIEVNVGVDKMNSKLVITK